MTLDRRTGGNGLVTGYISAPVMEETTLWHGGSANISQSPTGNKKFNDKTLRFLSWLECRALLRTVRLLYVMWTTVGKLWTNNLHTPMNGVCMRNVLSDLCSCPASRQSAAQQRRPLGRPENVRNAGQSPTSASLNLSTRLRKSYGAV